MSIETAVTVNIISTSLAVLTYGYLFGQYRYAYIAKWVIAWVLLAIRAVFLENTFITQSLPPVLVILHIGLTIAYSLLMIAGTMEFAGKRLAVIWPVASVICLLISSVGILLQLPFQFYASFAIVFIGSAYIATGLIFWKIDIQGIGKYLTATAFILLGIHLFDMPFLFAIPGIAPWGYLLDGLLKLLVGIGIVFVFFEKTKNELEKYYRLLAENTTDVIYRYQLDNSARFEYISPAVKQLTGYESGAFKNIRQVMRVVYKDDRAKFKELLRNFIVSDGLTAFRLVNKSGDIMWTEQKHSLVTNMDGKPVAVEGIVRDVTKRMLLEQDVARLDRLNIAGQMAANLAHEVRNPLTTIRGYLQLLGNKQEFAHYKGQLGMLLEELDRTNHIITEYLSLSKDKIVSMRKCSLNDIVQALYLLLQTDAIPSKIEVILDLGKVPDLFVDDKEIKQLVLNLTRNAIEAMPTGGRLEIQTSSTDEETMISVKDQGKGIPSQVMHNLGKPFLTTKENGTGLGMAICYRIAGRHHAKMEIETGPAGTTVYVKFRNS